MIPFLPGRRRPDDPASRAHARAIELAAMRLSEALLPEEDAWLDGHLAECESCAAIAAGYEADARLLRSMPTPEAPRDLWARTAAAIQAEPPPGRRSRRRPGSLAPSLVPLGALSGALVVGVVVLASLLSSPSVQPPSQSSVPLPSVAAASTTPLATPIAVVAGAVGWVTQQHDGTYALAFAPVDSVCAQGNQPDCAPLAPASPVALDLQATPGAIVSAPSSKQLVVVDSRTKTTGGALYVVDLPSASPSAAPTASGGAAPSGSASGSPTAAASTAGSPAPSPTSGTTSSPTASPASSATASAAASPPVSASPSATVPTLQIISDVVVVGETGAYSPDGQWFAFSARPADGSQGPDIYVWSPGDPEAHAVTTDHRSVFAGWEGDLIIGSRAVPLDQAEGGAASPSPSAAPDGASPSPPGNASPDIASPEPSASDPAPSGSPSPNPVLATPVSFILDPSTGASADVPGVAWRPVVDPTGTYAAFWQGTLRLDSNGVDWVPDTGQLVLARWAGIGIQPVSGSAATASPDPLASPSPDQDGTAPPPASPAAPSATPPSPEAPASPSGADSATAAPSASPSPATLPVALSGGSVGDWDMHWDETGTRLAVWLADPVDPTIGALTLHTLDRSNDTLDGHGILLDQQPALPGFSIGAGRLAWATPPGQGGQESQVQVLAWTGAEAGLIQSDPGQGPGPVVVIR